MVKFADGPSGDDSAGGLAALPKTKSFASKSLGESEKSGIQVTLYQLRYKVPNMVNKKEWKYLLGGLEPLSGTLDPGNMIALMGSSGAGKSTLMDVISKRKTVGIIEGHGLRRAARLPLGLLHGDRDADLHRLPEDAPQVLLLAEDGARGRGHHPDGAHQGAQHEDRGRHGARRLWRGGQADLDRDRPAEQPPDHVLRRAHR